MITLHIHYSNRVEYYRLSSLWAANLIAIEFMRSNPQIDHIFVVDTESAEIYKTYVRQ